MIIIKRFIIIKKKSLFITILFSIINIFLICILARYFFKNNTVSLPDPKSEYVILAANDLGMHCYQKSYSSFLILPPGNNIKVQVFRNEGKEAKLINSGIEVRYSIIDNTTSADKINFWEYAKDFGYNIEPNEGITGNGLSGKMQLSEDKKYFIATGIPVTPYNDGSTVPNPYQLSRIAVVDINTGKVLASTNNVVVPVSNEMDCNICHGNVDTDLNILKAHDKRSGTNLAKELANGKRYNCSNCHKDNILNAPGKPGIEPLSEAMHGFHSNKMSLSNIKIECYSCHPGRTVECNRGVMSAQNITCTDCHGSMADIAATQKEGRQAWLQEPDCGQCHGELYSANPGKLYRNSYLINNLNSEMNGIIQCESCHNSTHAEWKSTNPIDNLLPEQLLGYPSYIDKCTVCHEGKGIIHQKKPPQ